MRKAAIFYLAVLVHMRVHHSAVLVALVLHICGNVLIPVWLGLPAPRSVLETLAQTAGVVERLQS